MTIRAFLLAAIIGFGGGLGVGALMQASIPVVFRAAETHPIARW